MKKLLLCSLAFSAICSFAQAQNANVYYDVNGNPYYYAADGKAYYYSSAQQAASVVTNPEWWKTATPDMVKNEIARLEFKSKN